MVVIEIKDDNELQRHNRTNRGTQSKRIVQTKKRIGQHQQKHREKDLKQRFFFFFFEKKRYPVLFSVP